MAALLFVVVYLRGAFALIPFENDYHTCTSARFGVPDGGGLPPFIDLDRGGIPPSGVCRWKDGHSLDLVPAYVAPVLGILIVLSAGAALLAAVAGKRRSPNLG
ncbi:hypothetical protein [Spirillospora sp. NPDC029432]|uniref:hypothetical protein n=1 Tax=Spirillospora sp. NPDC029432 TaxID=3154599 RepID=UPI00345609FA